MPIIIMVNEGFFVSFGLLEGRTIAIVHTEDDGLIRIISARKASKYEQRIYFERV